MNTLYHNGILYDFSRSATKEEKLDLIALYQIYISASKRLRMSDHKTGERGRHWDRGGAIVGFHDIREFGQSEWRAFKAAGDALTAYSKRHDLYMRVLKMQRLRRTRLGK